MSRRLPVPPLLGLRPGGDHRRRLGHPARGGQLSRAALAPSHPAR